MSIMDIPSAVWLSQLLVGAINGAFYALLSLGLSLIFGMLRVVNFAHGAQYMMGAFFAWMLLKYAGIGYWGALFIAPLAAAGLSMLVERLMLSRLYRLDASYGLLFTFGMALLIEGVFKHFHGVSGLPYPAPAALTGGVDLGFMYLPIYRGWVVAVSVLLCVATWLVIEKTRVGALLRAATERPALVQAFGVNVPLVVSLTYGSGVMLAAIAGVVAAPVYSVNALMGANLIIVVFAVVVIGGMGSILGSVLTGFGMGLIEGLTKVVYPQASSTIIFVIMVLVLCFRPAGLFGKDR